MTDIETLTSYNDVIMLNGIGILCNYNNVMDDIQPWYAYNARITVHGWFMCLHVMVIS